MAREELPVTYRTRKVETLGRNIRIITQPHFDNCPLVATCNALLLRMFHTLDPSAEEVSRQELLNLVGLAVLDLNGGFQNESEEHASIREQNTNFYLTVLHHLAHERNMVVRSTKISDFEHTPELEILNLLDVGPYHGWVVDPQDTEIVAVIGSKSHQTLMAELTAFRDLERNSIFQGGHPVDSAAGTGVASPDFAKGSDSHDSSHSSVKQRRGDEQELEGMNKALKLSLDHTPSSDSDCSYRFSKDSTETENSESEVDDDSASVSSKDKSGNSQLLELSKQSVQIAPDSCNYEEIELLKGHEPSCGTRELPVSNDTLEKVQNVDTIQDQAVLSVPRDTDNSQGCYSFEDEKIVSVEAKRITKTVTDCNTSNGTSDLVDISGKVVEDFLVNIGSQLTVYGLDCLKKEIREEDPCVFFCNNRFSTILKFNDGLYLLATDEDYINKPDFVWVKLDEMYQVNSDRVLMTGKFEEVKVDQENSSLLDDSDISLDSQGALMLQDLANEANP